MTDPTGNSEFCFPSTSNIEGLGETKLTVSLGASHQVLIVNSCNHVTVFFYLHLDGLNISLNNNYSIIIAFLLTLFRLSVQFVA